MAISTMAEALKRTKKAELVIWEHYIETSQQFSTARDWMIKNTNFRPITPQELLNEIEAIEFDSLWDFIVNNNAKKLAERLCKQLHYFGGKVGFDDEKLYSSKELLNYYKKIVEMECKIRELKEYFEIEETEPKSQPAPQKQETTPSPLSDPTAETMPTATATQQDEQPSPKKESSDSKRRQQVKLSDQQKEELGQYFTADFRGMKDNWNKAKINYFNGIIEEIEAKEWLKCEFAIIALVIFESTKTLNSRINKKNGFSDWYRKFCQAIGIKASTQVKIERLRNKKQYQQIKKSINIWDE